MYKEGGMRVLGFLFFFSFSFSLLGQYKGMPFYRVYEPQEYQAHRQNWTSDQGEDGTMYFANTKGLLIYNGEDWQLKRLPNQGHVRSLKVMADNIYVGANNELGYFQKKDGTYSFHSFLQHVPDSLLNFGRVWTTLVHGDAVFFQTDSFVMRIKNHSEPKFWTFEDGRIWKLILQNNKLYLIVLDKGLFELGIDDTFVPHPFSGGFKFAGSEFLLPVAEGWVFEASDALSYFDGNKVIPFNNEASSIFKEYGINTAILTSTGKIVVATLRKGGVVILDQNGRLERHLRSENGFTNNVVRGVFEDNQQAIWFTLENGISRLDIDSPLSFFDSRLGLNGTVMDIQVFQEKLYVATTDGLMVLGNNKFERVNNNKSIVWDLDTIQKQLLAVTSFDDTFVIDSLGKTTSLPHQKSAAKYVNRRILPLKENPNSAIILFHTGLFQIKWTGKAWITEDRIEDLYGSAYGIEQSEPGIFWIATNTSGIHKIEYQLNENGLIEKSNILIRSYGKDKGVPDGFNKIFSISGDFYFQSATDDFHHFNSKTDSFEKTTQLPKQLRINDPEINMLQTEVLGNVWFSSEKQQKKYLYKVEVGNEEVLTTQYPLGNEVLLLRDPFSTMEFHTSGENVFVGGSKGMASYDLSKLESISRDVSLQISEIKTKDSVFGTFEANETIINLPYNRSEIRFEFASAIFKDAEHKKYMYKLEGHDEKWTLPVEKNYAEYTSLPPGDYVFKVKALNDYFFESPEVVAPFTVNRPWFWNQVSIPVYLVLLILLIYLFSYWRNRSLQEKNLRLEKAVNKAVEEMKRQADEIAHLYEVKNQFFSNISHELRTPLTLILGPSSDLLESGAMPPHQKNKLTFINNNAKRLLRLINQLLDLSKLEAGKLELRASQQNIVKLVIAITESFSSMATAREIHLECVPKVKEIHVFYDADKLEKVLINLLSNAMKFTKPKGSVFVSVNKTDNTCVISVKDTGIGINNEQLPYVFDRFYQADNTESREHEGTGIGLSLSKELIELHGGSITVTSEPQVGSTFEISLPLGKAHLQEHQLAKLNVPKIRTVEEVMEPIAHLDISDEEFGEKKLVLLVEDNMEMRNYIKSHLDQEFGILEAENGLEGLQMAKEHVPDLIISDVMMPKMDGTQLCKSVKEDDITSHIPIVLLTAKASEEDRIQGLRIEADAYLAKPFNKVELKAVIQNLIANRKKLQKRFANTTLISPKEIAVTSMEQQFLEKLVEEIEENIGDESFGVEQLADTINLSRSQLHRKMISITNQTPSLFIRKYRLERAKNLLEQGAGRVSDIAFQVGFSSPSYFTKYFVEEFGKTPKNAAK